MKSSMIDYPTLMEANAIERQRPREAAIREVAKAQYQARCEQQACANLRGRKLAYAAGFGMAVWFTGFWLFHVVTWAVRGVLP